MRIFLTFCASLLVTSVPLASRAALPTTEPATVTLDVHVGRPVPDRSLKLPVDPGSDAPREFGTLIDVHIDRNQPDVVGIDYEASKLDEVKDDQGTDLLATRSPDAPTPWPALWKNPNDATQPLYSKLWLPLVPPQSARCLTVLGRACLYRGSERRVTRPMTLRMTKRECATIDVGGESVFVSTFDNHDLHRIQLEQRGSLMRVKQLIVHDADDHLVESFCSGTGWGRDGYGKYEESRTWSVAAAARTPLHVEVEYFGTIKRVEVPFSLRYDIPPLPKGNMKAKIRLPLDCTIEVTYDPYRLRDAGLTQDEANDQVTAYIEQTPELSINQLNDFLIDTPSGRRTSLKDLATDFVVKFHLPKVY